MTKNNPDPFFRFRKTGDSISYLDRPDLNYIENLKWNDFIEYVSGSFVEERNVQEIASRLQQDGFFRKGDEIIRFLPDGKLYQTIRRQHFSVLLDSVCRLASKKARTEKEKTIIPIEYERDAHLILGYSPTHKYVKSSVSDASKRSAFENLCAYLPSIESIASHVEIDETLQVNIHTPGFDPETNRFFLYDKHKEESFRKTQKRLEGMTETQVRQEAQNLVSDIFGSAISFTSRSAQNDKLLAFIVATALPHLLKNHPLPGLWITTNSEFYGQGAGKSHIGACLAAWMGSFKGKISSSKKGSFSEQQFNREMSNALSNDHYRVIELDNVIAPDNEVGEFPMLSSILTSSSRYMNITLTGKGGDQLISLDRLFILNGNMIYPGADYKRRFIFFELDAVKNKSIKSGSILQMSSDQKEELRGRFMALVDYFSKYPQVIHKVINNSPLMATQYQDFCSQLSPFICWAFCKQSFLTEGDGIYKSIEEENPLTFLLQTLHNHYGATPFSSSEIFAIKELKDAALSIDKRTARGLGKTLSSLLNNEDISDEWTLKYQRTGKLRQYFFKRKEGLVEDDCPIHMPLRPSAPPLKGDYFGVHTMIEKDIHRDASTYEEEDPHFNLSDFQMFTAEHTHLPWEKTIEEWKKYCQNGRRDSS